jgi:hypothetical protein
MRALSSFLILVLVGGCLLLSCPAPAQDKQKKDEDPPGSESVQSGGGGWSMAVDKPLPGIDHGILAFVKYRGKPGAMHVVIWTDLKDGGSGGSVSGLPGGGFNWDGKINSNDRKKTIEVMGSSKDGKTGTMKIAGKKFDLTKGSLFLVSTQKEEPVVRQFKRDMSSFPTEIKGWQALAGKDKVIRGFFTEPSAKKSIP